MQIIVITEFASKQAFTENRLIYSNKTVINSIKAV